MTWWILLKQRQRLISLKSVWLCRNRDKQKHMLTPPSEFDQHHWSTLTLIRNICTLENYWSVSDMPPKNLIIHLTQSTTVSIIPPTTQIILVWKAVTRFKLTELFSKGSDVWWHRKGTYLTDTAENKWLAIVIPVCPHTQVHFLRVCVPFEGFCHPQDGIRGSHLHLCPPWAKKKKKKKADHKKHEKRDQIQLFSLARGDQTLCWKYTIHPAPKKQSSTVNQVTIHKPDGKLIIVLYWFSFFSFIPLNHLFNSLK